MKRKIKVTVVYPVTFETLIDDTQDIYEIRDKILNEADDALLSSSVDPVIVECPEMPELEE